MNILNSFLFQNTSYEIEDRRDSKLLNNFEDQKARPFLMLVWGSVILFSITSVLVGFFMSQSFLQWILAVVIYDFVCLGLIFLNRKGLTKLASYIFIGTLVALINALAIVAGGIKTPVFLTFPLIVLVSGLLLGREMGVLTGLFGIINGLVIVLMKYSDNMTVNTVFFGSLSMWVISSSFISIVALLQILFFDSMNKTSQKAQKGLSFRISNESRIEAINENYATTMTYKVNIKRDGTRKFTYLSNSVQQLYGISPDEGIANATLIYGKVYEDDFKLLIKAEEDAIENFSTFNAEVRIYEPSGKIRWSLLVSTPAKLDDGSILWDGIEFVITERKKREQALRESEAINKLVTSLITDYIFKFEVGENNNLSLVFTSENFLEFTGRTISETSDMSTWTDIFHPDDLPKVNKFIQQILSEANPGEMECRSQVKEKTRWISIIAKPETDKITGRVISVTLAVKDISDKKKAEEQLRFSEEKFLKAFLCAPDSVTITSMTTGLFVDTNEVLLKRTGYQRHELIGKSSIDLNFWVDLNERDKIIKSLNKYNSIKEFETKLRMRSGEIKDCLISGELVEINREKYVIFYIRDITWQKKYDENLRISKQRLTDIFNLTPSIIGITRQSDNKIIDGNLEMTLLSGYQRDEYIGKTTTELGLWENPNDREIVMEKLNDYGEVRNFEVNMRIKNGKVLTCLLSAKPHTYNNEPCLLWVINDISERKRAEEELQVNAEKYHIITNTSMDGFAIVDRNNRILDVNDAYSRMIGYSREELLNMSVSDIEAISTAEDINEQQKKAMIESQLLETRHRCKDGSIIDVEVNMTFMPTTNQLFVFLRDITKRKQAEESLRKSENKFVKIFNLAPASMALSDIGTGRFIDVNDFICTTLEYKREEMIGHTSKELKIWADAKVRDEGITKLKKFGSFKETPVQFVTKNGGIRETLWSAEIISFGDTEVMLTLIYDYTERKAAEDKLRESEELYRNLVEMSPDGISITDLKGKVLMCNKQMAALTGYDSVEQMIGMNALDVVVPEDNGSIRDTVRVLIEKGRAEDLQFTYMRRDGSRFKADYRGSIILNSKGLPYAFMGVITDITEKLLAEEKFKQLAELHQTIIDTITLGLIFIKERKTQWVNNAITKMFDYEYEELIGKDAFIYYGSEEMYKNVGSEGYTQLSKGNTYTTELQGKKKDGSLFWCYLTSKAINPQNLSEGSIWIVQDIDERKIEEEKFKQLADLHQTIIDTMTVGLTFVKGRKTQWSNKVFCKMLGYEFEETINAETSIIYKNEEDYSRVGDEAYAKLAKGETYAIELMAKRKNGSSFWINLVGKAIDPGNPLYGSIWMLQDINERKIADEALRESEEKFSRIVNTAIEGIIVVNEAFIINYVNAQMAEMLGYETEEMINRPFESFIYETELDDQKIKRENRMKGQFERYERRFYKKNGTIVWLLVSSSPIIDPEKGFHGSFAMFTDITERKETERRVLNATLEAEEHERNYFARELHDGLGPLLSSIKLYFQWLNKPKIKTPKEEIISNIDNTINEAISSVKEISQKLSPHVLINFGLIHALKSYIEKLKETVSVKIKLDSNIEQRFEKEIEITLYRVISECINNTLKYAKAKNITIKVFKEKDKINVEYFDNGIGFNYDEVTKSAKGLGLFNMQNRIATLGGNFSIDTQPGKGVKIKVCVKSY
jgi:PAS domain S-box-containing protein